MSTLTALLKNWFAHSTPRQKLTAGLLAFSLLATGALFALGNGSSASTNSQLDLGPMYFLGVFVKLLGVLLLIVGSALLLRRWMPFSAANNPARQLRLLETARLSPKQALHLVAIGDQRLLIGATDQGISLLARLESGSEPTPAAAQPQPTLDFKALLQSATAEKEQG